MPIGADRVVVHIQQMKVPHDTNNFLLEFGSIDSEWYKARFLKWAFGIGEAAAPSARSPKATHDESYALVRGASYYGGGSHEK